MDKLPPFWDKSVIFISNIFSLFFGNKKQISELHKEVGALETYGARMVPILNLLFKKPNNLLLLETEPDKNLRAYFRWLGLSLPDIRTVKKDLPASELANQLKGHTGESLYGYVIDDYLKKVADKLGKPTIGSSEGCFNGNNKRLIHEHLKEKGYTVFDSLDAANLEEIKTRLTSLKKMGYKKAVIKSSIGASGIGMKKINLDKVDLSIPEYLFYEGPALVQGWLDNSVANIKYIASPSVLLFVDDRDCWLYDLTEQILSEHSIHEGNIAPPPFLKSYPEAKELILRQANHAGAWLKEQGYRGTASIDFHVVKRIKTIEVRVCEINARVTGATYPAVLARHFSPQSAWLLRNIRFSPSIESDEILNSLEKNNNLLFNGSNQGVLPFNFNTDRSGKVFKGQFIFIAKEDAEVYHLLDQIKKSFSIPGAVDRD